jgi:hypothetical protein
MDLYIKELMDNLGSTNSKIRLIALNRILKLTESQVDWIYDVWDVLFKKLKHKNSYQRSIAIMLLCNLAKSDTKNRLADSINHLLFHTNDDKFITSRQCIQNIWKIATTNTRNKEIILAHLEKLFKECVEKKHYNLIRQDIIKSLGLLYEKENDNTILARARKLIANEEESKYRKKYEAILKIKCIE